MTDSEFEVTLNGVDLVEGFDKDFYILPDQQLLRVIIRRPKPYAQARTWPERFQLFLQGRWSEAMSSHRDPYPDMVVINNWAAGWRKLVIFGTDEFPNFVLYEEDLQK